MKKFTLLRFCATFIFLIIVISLTGCLESSFELAPESRLPKWLEAPEGVTRSDLRVTMDYYSTLSGGEYVFRFYDKNKFLKIKKLTIDVKLAQDIKINDTRQGPLDYPQYFSVTVDGVVDIVEHKKMEPIFYMTDDPVVWKALGLEKK